MQLSYYELLANTCRNSYFEFVKRFWHTVSREPLVANWHFPYLCAEIQASTIRAMNGEPCPYDTVVNISPGTSKSTLFSIFLLPWAWTINPSIKMIGASFTEALAFDLSAKSRQVITSPLYQKCFPHIKIRPDVNNKGHWENTLLGARFAVGVGGDVIGRHGHLIVIDDPLNPQGARSKADIERAHIWCKETIPTRKINKQAAWTALVMQRLSVEDPTALYLARPNVKHICLPGELTDNVFPVELREKYVDGLFDPVRLTRASLDKMKSDMGTYGYAGQILQTPIPPGGGMFNTEAFRYSTAQPEASEFKRIVRYWDKAGSEKQGDYTVGVKMGLHKDGSYWVLDVVRGQWASSEREGKIKSTAQADGIEVRIGLEEEPGSAGKDSSLMTIRNLPGYYVSAEKATGDKVTRADTFSVQVNAGNVVLLRRPWNDRYVEEFMHFPDGKNDDQVDASSGAFSRLFNYKPRLGVFK